MKKILTILACVLLVGALALSALAAYDNSSAELVASKTSLYRGETFTVDVVFTNTENASVVVSALSFDETVLELTGGTCHIASHNPFLTKPISIETKTAQSLCNEVVNGKAFTFNFKVKENAAFGEYEIDQVVSLMVDNSYSNDNVTATGATVKVVCNHSFTQQTATSDYLKNGATCTKQAEYYKSCSVCGEKGTETFFDGALAAHTFTKKVTTDAYKVSGATCTAKAVYNFCCENCTAKGTETFESGEKAAHTFTKKVTTDAYLKDGATCTSKATYYYCCQTCTEKGTATFESGNTLPHTFTKQVIDDAYIKKAAKCGEPAEYYYCCENCTAKGNTTYTYGQPGEHIFTEKVTTDAYKVSGATCTAKAVYNYSCSCGEKGTTTFEHGEKLPHTFTKKDTAETYLVSAATCTAKAIYNYSCEVCGEKGTTTFENGEMLPHTNIEEVADEYLKSQATCQAKAVYYKSCEVCGKAATDTFETGEKADHSYTVWTEVDETNHKSVCDTEGCGEFKTEAHKYDEKLTAGTEKHWNECACGKKTNEADHTFDKKVAEKAFEKTPATCTAKAVYFVSCACGAKSTETFESGEVAAHTLKAVAAKPATTTEEGYEAHYQCDVCKALFADDKAAKPIEKPVAIPKLEKDAVPSNGDTSLIVATVLLVVLSVCGIATVVTLKKRNVIG